MFLGDKYFDEKNTIFSYLDLNVSQIKRKEGSIETDFRDRIQNRINFFYKISLICSNCLRRNYLLQGTKFITEKRCMCVSRRLFIVNILIGGEVDTS